MLVAVEVVVMIVVTTNRMLEMFRQISCYYLKLLLNLSLETSAENRKLSRTGNAG